MPSLLQSSFSALLLACVCATGCAAAPEATGEKLQFFTESGTLEVYLLSTELTRGENSVELCFYDAQAGAPVEQLSLSMTPFMPAMGHGSSGPSPGVEQGDGCYLFESVVLSMPGTWELRTSITEPVRDAVVPSFYVK